MSLVRHLVRLLSVAAFLVVPSLRAATIPQETIDRTVERGVAALRKLQAADGSFSATGGYSSGPTALATLALLECGANPSDEYIRKAVAVVRAECPSMNRVYNLSLTIMLLDRVGDPLDEQIIHVLTVRLLEGQTENASWGYVTPEVSGDEAAKLKTMIERRAEMKTAPNGGNSPSRHAMDPAIIDRLKRLERRDKPAFTEPLFNNSTTQFAVLGCWVGRRHGIPTDAALKRTEAYFRATQAGGRWGYTPGADVLGDLRVSNTCAGLLGLAVGTGLIRERQLRTQSEGKEGKEGKPTALRDPMRDPVVQAAMNYVGEQAAELAATGLEADTNRNRNLYFLWSLERVGVVYSVAKIGGVDWYQVGAATILRAQKQDGSWGPSLSNGWSASVEINTSFALLFLRRSNVASDLTANLRAKSRPVTMRSGGDKADPPDAKLSEAEQLARELPTATPDRQQAILTQVRDGKGNEYTDALAHIIPKLSGDIKKNARDALAERLARMTAATVRAKLKDENIEVRRAAALACAIKEDKSFIPDLIGVLDDKDVWVVRAAAVALRTLTDQDFGPSVEATPAQRAASIAAWNAWWKRQNGK